AENIFRFHQAGYSRRDACVRGAGEISLAIVMATLTTMVVFLPVSLVEGAGQFFLLRLSIPITVSLLASLLVALIFVPLSVYLTLGRSGPKENKLGEKARSVMKELYDRSFGRINRGYNSILAFFLRRRLDLVMAVTAVVAITVAWPAQKVESGVVQEDERGGFEVDVQLPPSTTLEEAEAHFGRVEKILEAKQQEWDLQTYLIIHSRSGGEVQGWFNTPRNNDVSTRELVEQLVALMPERAGSEIYTGLGSDDADERKNLQIYRLVGEDPRQLETLGSDLEGVLGGVEGVIGVKQTAAEGSEEMAIRLDRERVQRLGINPQAVAGVIRNSIGGRSLPKFYRDGREIPVRVRYQEEDRESLGQLWDFRVPTESGDVVAVGSVTRAERMEGADRIFRTNKQVTRSITLELRAARGMVVTIDSGRMKLSKRKPISR
ncbi:MAG: efflux RND transporter permease subunit, partial [Acidobacteriota bacterium]